MSKRDDSSDLAFDVFVADRPFKKVFSDEPEGHVQSWSVHSDGLACDSQDKRSSALSGSTVEYRGSFSITVKDPGLSSVLVIRDKESV
jgi:hypothetical protein